METGLVPELPEVETVVRSVAPHLVGNTIQHAEFHSRQVTRQDHRAMACAIRGATIDNIRRRGKQILMDLDRGLLYVHLGMTGKLLWCAGGERPTQAKHVRAMLHFKDGALLYDDPRMFGRFEFYAASPKPLDEVGPDALSVTEGEFAQRLRKHRGFIKAVLLNQRFLAGVGNIYADESLFAARIHPRARTARLSSARVRVLYQSLSEVLRSAIEYRGSSISDYVDGSGERGGYQQHHNVYGRQGKPCPRCGSAIRRIVLGQRGTHYCPRCQRA